jgi:hypothetical protein
MNEHTCGKAEIRHHELRSSSGVQGSVENWIASGLVVHRNDDFMDVS